MSTAAAVLYIAGATIEFAGIMLAAAPDLVPQGRRLSEWTRRQSERLATRVLRLIGRGRPHILQMTGAASAEASASAFFSKSVPGDASVERKLEFLLQRDQEAQRDVQVLQTQGAALDTEGKARLAALREELEGRVAVEIVRSHEAYLPLRLAGVVLIVIGLTCATLANFV